MKMKNAMRGKTYTTLLFDADDTLLDFQACEYDALGILFERMDYPVDDGARALYREINKHMWLDYERGSIEKEELCNTRFRILFERLGRSVDGVFAEAVYRDALGRGAQTVADALEVCEALGKRYEMHIVTNGVYETQIRRLADSGLDTFFGHIFVSEAIGHAKPSRRFPAEGRRRCWSLGTPLHRIYGEAWTRASTPAGSTPAACGTGMELPRPMRLHRCGILCRC